eukprot:CAMPEP_0201285434 /NCGR_PEP_ID=MMETSP1317-20130820/107827_1 /ASSEMBLY_ACC=CAM_ASM_000770 /TAXON_ID=187299 /ORGANISM="Undescribed Undescribed, Strain Undescribed" /LENGTH=194 /DNA_ID=CAMNT_0047610311 /DNA_START=359 /DNA_END=943 /DNA_ORIENTATION=+
MNNEGIMYISGDANDETTLINAGIKKAKGLVAALAKDAENVFLVLTAKQLNPDIFIIAKAEHNNSKLKLQAAGADIVEYPYEIGAEKIAHRILRPTIAHFLDFAFGQKDIHMEEFLVDQHSELTGLTLKDSGIKQNFNLIIIAIKKSDGIMTFAPSREAVISAGDTVIAVGKNENLNKIEKIFSTGDRGKLNSI